MTSTCYSQRDSVVINSLIIPKTYWDIYEPNSVPKLVNGKPFTGVDSSLFSYKGKDLLGVETFKDGFKIELKTFYKNGKPENHFQFKSGKRNGISKGWYESGKMMFDDIIQDDEILGTSIQYYENGNPESVFDKKHGISISFYENGKVKLRTKYINDSSRCPNKNSFESTEWYEDGQLMNKEIANCGKQSYKEYYNDTSIGRESTIIDMSLFHVGKFTEWYKNGKLKKEAFYKDGRTQSEANIKTGVWKYYNEKGKIEKEEYYENNELIKTKEYGKPKKIKESEK